jgi:hypothetical protein
MTRPIHVNPPVHRCPSCDSRSWLAYVSTLPSDDASHGGLSQLAQMRACRQHTHRVAHRRLEATFADSPSSQREGLRSLLAHLAVCHNETVVVHRLDRLSPSDAIQIVKKGARIVPTDGGRLPRDQEGFFEDLAELVGEHPKRRANPKARPKSKSKPNPEPESTSKKPNKRKERK